MGTTRKVFVLDRTDIMYSSIISSQLHFHNTVPLCFSVQCGVLPNILNSDLDWILELSTNILSTLQCMVLTDFYLWFAVICSPMIEMSQLTYRVCHEKVLSPTSVKEWIINHTT